MGAIFTTNPWRNLETPDFLTAEKVLKSSIGKISKAQLNLVMIGHVGAGKSSFINTVCSISKGKIANKTNTMGDNQAYVGTTNFLPISRRNHNFIDNVHLYDTAGFSPDKSDGSLGVQITELKAVCEGRVPAHFRFNADETLQEPSKENKPHCIIFIISAEQLNSDSIEKNRLLIAKYEQVNKIIPFDVARIVVITKMDRVCIFTASNIEYIYTSRIVYNLVKKATNLLGVEENVVFPVVNFTKEDYVEPLKSVPILYALNRAINFASDRQESNGQ